jgi:hypothetical protein
MFRKKKTGEPKKKKSLLRRILKWTGITFLLLLILAIILPFLFQKQIFEFVKKEINNNLKAEFKCEDYSMTLISTFPNFTLELKNVELNGKGEFKGTSLLKVKSLLVTVDIKSVLWGDKIDIKKIGIVDANIDAIVLPNGKPNWDIVKSEEEKTPEEKSEPSKFHLALEKYYIENTNIVYDDRQGGTLLKISTLNHEGKGDFTADQDILQTTTTATAIDFSMGGMGYMKKVKTDIKLAVDMDLKNNKFVFKENSFVLNDFKLDFDGWISLAKDMVMDIKFKSNENTFKSLLSLVPGAYTKDYSNVKVNGSTKFDGFVKGTLSDKSMPAFAVNLDVKNGSFHYPGLPESATGIFIDGKASAGGDPSMNDMKINIPKIIMSLGGNPLSAHFNLVTPMTDPGIDLGVKTDINLATLKNVIPVGEGESYNGHLKADVAVKGHLSALEAEDYEKFTATGDLMAEGINYTSKELGYDTKINKAELRFSPKILELAAFDSEVGKTSLKANGKLENYLPYVFKGETIKGNLDVNSPLVDLKEFMGTTSETPAATNTAPANTTAAAPVDPNASYVIAIPKNIDFVMNTSFGKVIYPALYQNKPDLVLENVSGGLIMRDETLMFENLKMNTLGGEVVLGGSYNTTNIMEPAIKMTYNIQNLDIRQTSQTFNAVEKMAPIASKCTGKFSSVFNMNAKLDKQLSPEFNTLTGQGFVASKDIFIEGFEPLNKLAQELKIQKLAKQSVSDIKVFFEFKDGKVWVKPYDVKIGNYKTNISGNTAFTGEIDYDMAMIVPRSEFGGEANNVLNSLVDKANKSGADVKLGDNVNLKIKMTGTVTDPKLKTNLKEQLNDVKEDVKEEIKEKVKEEIKEVKEDVNAKLDAQKKQILADAQVQADKIKAEGKRLADQERDGAKKAGDKLMEEAGNNPIKKKVAEKAADKLKKEGEDKAQKIENEANAKADKVMSEAQTKADNLKVK